MPAHWRGWATHRPRWTTSAPRSASTESWPRMRGRTKTSNRCAAALPSSSSRLPRSSRGIRLELDLQRLRVDSRPARGHFQARQVRRHLHRITYMRPLAARRKKRALQDQRESLGDGLEVETGLGRAGHHTPTRNENGRAAQLLYLNADAPCARAPPRSTEAAASAIR